jgi:Domain of unknown function (DUF4249)
VLLILLGSCIDPYRPPEVTTDLRLMVVDGFVNTSDGSIRVDLSRSNSPSVPEKPTPEKFADVSVTSDGGDRFVLAEQDSGVYLSEGLTLESASKYQLHVRSQSGEELISDYVTAKQSPAIDSITWGRADDGMNVYVNTHDPTRKTKYYHWDYVETWEYTSPYTSFFKTDGESLIQRRDSERIDRCWRTLPSSKIEVGNSGPLDQDVIRNRQLMFIPKESHKVSIRYSMLVTQRGIDEKEYQYYQQLQKTTENHGGLFDPLPSRVVGNVKQLRDSSLYVLGNFSAGGITQKRLFITHEELPERLQTSHDLMGCTYRVAPFTLSTQEIILYPVFVDGLTLLGYAITSIPCADCRVQGGSLTRPDFW